MPQYRTGTEHRVLSQRNGSIIICSFIVIIAFCIFIFISIMNKFFSKKKDSKKSDDVILLEEIRDLLKKEL